MAVGPTPTGPRRLLRRIRDVMGREADAQIKLNRIVRAIARYMGAEVCSVYIQRAGEVLELFATRGLNPKAVHFTRLRVGEGLVGEIAAHAQPLALADAQSHPAFAYRPETGEEAYHSLMGVPILRSGRVAGVVVVQNKTRRRYTEDEVEVMETIAMLLGALIAGGELVNPEERAPAEGNAVLPMRLDAVQINSGLAMGTAVIHRPDIAIRQIVAENLKVELARFEDAVTEVHRNLDRIFATRELAEAGEHREVLEAFRMVAADLGWLDRIRDAIRSGLTAEAAVQQVRENTRMRMQQVRDPYLRERLSDVEDLALRFLQQLTGSGEPAARRDLPDNMVLVSRNMGPAELLDYDTSKLRALVLEEGSPTAHVCIVARALEIPVLGQVKDVFAKVDPGDTVIVDGDNVQLYVRPADEIVSRTAEILQMQAQRRAAFARLRDQPAVTRDGTQVTLNLNAGLELDMPQLEATGADGIGLFRTEIPFMVRAAYPDVEAQTTLYRTILDQAKGKPVAFRTLDVGGDKLLPYFESEAGENPALGWRAIRIALDRPAMLRQQFRALVRAARGRPLSIMFPMIAEVAEFDRARHILDIELTRERKARRKLPCEFRVGAMIEVPALLWQLPQLLRRVDFVSVGSNDLVQFLFAADRGDPQIAGRFDELSPVVLNVLRGLVRDCAKAGVPLSLCGEMAGRPLEALALIGLGFRSLSMTPAAVGPVKTMIQSLRIRPLEAYLGAQLGGAEHSIREKLRGFAHDHGILV